jgi:hypothetical protein
MSTKNSMPIRIQLLSRNTKSRLSSESIRLSERSSGKRQMISATQAPASSAMYQTKYAPMLERANECTLAIIPDRVRNVPKIVMKNVRHSRLTFHTLNMPRRSWSITECKNGVPARSGMNAAFSTGSQAQ